MKIDKAVWNTTQFRRRYKFTHKQARARIERHGFQPGGIDTGWLIYRDEAERLFGAMAESGREE